MMMNCFELKRLEQRNEKNEQVELEIRFTK